MIFTLHSYLNWVFLYDSSYTKELKKGKGKTIVKKYHKHPFKKNIVSNYLFYSKIVH